MQVSAVQDNIDSFATEIIVVGVFSPAEVPSSLKSVDEKLGGAITHAVKDNGFDAEIQQFRFISTLNKIPAKHILLVGLGKKEDADLETLRRMAGYSVKVVRDFCGVTKLATTLHDVDIGTPEERVQAVSEGCMLGSYQYLKFKTVDTDKIKIISDIVLLNANEDNVKRGIIIAGCANLVRDLANEPGSDLTPEKLANEAKKTGGIRC